MEEEIDSVCGFVWTHGGRAEKGGHGLLQSKHGFMPRFGQQVVGLIHGAFDVRF